MKISRPDPILICKSCTGAKHARQYLCSDCWWTLRPAARKALGLRDDKAVRRLSDLHDQLKRGIALHMIEIAR